MLHSASVSDSASGKGESEGKKKPAKNKHGEFGNVRLTDDEYAKLAEAYGDTLTKAIETLDNYIESKGKRYKSHYATMKRGGWVWERVKAGPVSTTADSEREAWQAVKMAVANEIWDAKESPLDVDMKRTIRTLRNKYLDAKRYRGQDAVTCGVDMALNNERGIR
jgi:hypothetical protein